MPDGSLLQIVVYQYKHTARNFSSPWAMGSNLVSTGLWFILQVDAMNSTELIVSITNKVSVVHFFLSGN